MTSPRQISPSSCPSGMWHSDPGSSPHLWHFCLEVCRASWKSISVVSRRSLHLALLTPPASGSFFCHIQANVTCHLLKLEFTHCPCLCFSALSTRCLPAWKSCLFVALIFWLFSFYTKPWRRLCFANLTVTYLRLDPISTLCCLLSNCSCLLSSEVKATLFVVGLLNIIYSWGSNPHQSPGHPSSFCLL